MLLCGGQSNQMQEHVERRNSKSCLLTVLIFVVMRPEMMLGGGLDFEGCDTNIILEFKK